MSIIEKPLSANLTYTHTPMQKNCKVYGTVAYISLLVLRVGRCARKK